MEPELHARQSHQSLIRLDQWPSVLRTGTRPEGLERCSCEAIGGPRLVIDEQRHCDRGTCRLRRGRSDLGCATSWSAPAAEQQLSTSFHDSVSRACTGTVNHDLGRIHFTTSIPVRRRGHRYRSLQSKTFKQKQFRPTYLLIAAVVFAAQSDQRCSVRSGKEPYRDKYGYTAASMFQVGFGGMEPSTMKDTFYVFNGLATHLVDCQRGRSVTGGRAAALASSHVLLRPVAVLAYPFVVS